MATLIGPFLDTSILLAGLIDFGDGSKAPMELLDRIADKRIRKAATAWHCCLEFYSVATRLPEEFRLTPQSAESLITEEIIGRLEILSLNEPQQQGFFSEAAQSNIQGGRLYDFHIGSIALASKCSALVTENTKHFLPFVSKGLPVLTSKNFLLS